ncbi:MAG TPA: thiamine ABC transporter substrate-binding protein [Thermoplasmata archaeon]|nr:thiamine ABC transporter substrate-binding protein [Thermoplasmata archaeon]
MTHTSIEPREHRRVRTPGRFGRVLTASIVAVIVVLGAFGVAEYLTSGLGEPTLIVYTYSSLFGGSGTPAFDAVFEPFESAHHVRIDVEYPAGTLASTLLSEANAPEADLVIGLDEITAPQAEQYHLLTPYSPPELANVSSGLVDEISPDHGVVPYEYGYLAIDYNLSFAAGTHGAIERATFPEFTSNASWARQLLIEDPTVDITGEEFLAWEIEYYETVLHQNWTTFWKDVMPNLAYKPAPSWDEAFEEFTTPPGSPALVVSYSTDPAYAAFYNQSGEYNSTVSWWNGSAYGWRTIYGVGIVAGSRHLALDEEFEDWLLSGAVQSEIPTNEWEYPANGTVPLPSVFDAAIDPSAIVPLNNATTPAALAASIGGWVTTYEELADQYLPP